MNPPLTYRPWGDLGWALGLSEPKQWSFLGCLGTEQRSVAGLVKLHHAGILEDVALVRIRDTIPCDPSAEDEAIQANTLICGKEGLTFATQKLTLEAPLNAGTWPMGFDFSGKTNVCIDISSMPKRFFFSAVKQAVNSREVRNLLILYSVPERYPKAPQVISSNPNQWTSMDNFRLIDPALQQEVDSHLIICAGFVVDGLAAYLKNRTSAMRRSMLIPFPAEQWSSVRRSWESARSIDESLQIGNDEAFARYAEPCRRVGAYDSAGAFEILLGLTNCGEQPAALAPLGPKPISLAFCLLAAQSESHPVYYAQPRTYAVDYSTGCKSTHAYWIKHDGENFYGLSDARLRMRGQS